MKPTKKFSIFNFQFSIYFKQVEFWFVGGILLLAAFLRLYRISDYMTFLGDEGRDVLVAKHILEGDFTLLGPRASAGDFFLGPIYYYFMAPFLWLFGYDPVGPAIMVALFGVATVFLVYWIGKQFFSNEAALFASSLYAVSPLVISFSRSSWNPNPMPFFSLLTLFFLYKAVRTSSWKYFLLSGVLFGIAMQLHYIAVFLGIILVIFLFLGRILADCSIDFFKIGKQYIQLLLGFSMGFSPFLLFELRHGFPNTKTITSFISSDLSFIFFNLSKIEPISTSSIGSSLRTEFVNKPFLSIVSDVFFRLFGRFVLRYPPPEQVSVHDYMTKIDIFPSIQIPVVVLYYIAVVFLVASLVVLVFQLLKSIQLRNEKVLPMSLLCIWLFLGVVLFGFYKKPIYDYYFGFMFPLPFFLAGNALSLLYTEKKLRLAGKTIVIALFLFLLSLNLSGMPFRYLPNRQKEQVKAISDFILSKAEGKAFNFALITGGNSDHAYKYFFELGGNPPVTIENFEKDAKRESVVSQLFVVCESIPCHPLGHSLWEIAGFGQAEIKGEWNVSVVKIYKLTHYQKP